MICIIIYTPHTKYTNLIPNTTRFVVWNAAVLAALPGSTAGDPLEVLRSSGSPLVSGIQPMVGDVGGSNILSNLEVC